MRMWDWMGTLFILVAVINKWTGNNTAAYVNVSIGAFICVAVAVTREITGAIEKVGKTDD